MTESGPEVEIEQVEPDFRPAIIRGLEARFKAVLAACELAEAEARHVVDDEVYVSVGLIRNALRTPTPLRALLTDDDREFVRQVKGQAERTTYVGGCFGGGAWMRTFDPPTVERLCALIERVYTSEAVDRG